MTLPSVRLLSLGVLSTVVAGLFFVGTQAGGVGTGTCSWNQIPSTPTPAPSTTVLDQSSFVDRDRDGVPDEWGSSTDYKRSDCERSVRRNESDSLVKQVIKPAATNRNAEREESADVSIQRVYSAAPGQVYTATAEVDIGNYPLTGNEEDDFRGRLKLMPCSSVPCRIDQFGIEDQANLCISEQQDHDNTKGTERCVDYDRRAAGWKTLTVTTNPLPEGTRYLLIAWRVREHRTDSAWGNGRLTRIVLYRDW
jgi:hypothetical protein